MSRASLFLGSLIAVAMLHASQLQGQGNTSGQSVDADIARVEEQFRAAKVSNDVDALADVLHEAFVETNQNGNRRNKTEMIDLFRSFPILSLTTDTQSTRVLGNVAVVTGLQTEVNTSGTDQMLFARVYAQDVGRWRLISSTQFRNPNMTAQQAFAVVGGR